MSEQSDQAHIRSQYSLQFLEQGDFLRVAVNCSVDSQSVRIAYWRDLSSEATARGFRKLLVLDRKKVKPASPKELAEMAMQFQDEAANFDRIAVVEPTPEFLPAVEYGEILTQSVGINLRIFVEIQDAERWLRYGSPDD